MKIENAKVTITVEDPNELLEAMSPEETLDFLQSLSCQDEVVEYVLQQVFEGSTENGSHGSISCTWNGSAPLQKFRDKVLNLGFYDMANKRIEELERYMATSDKRNLELEDKLRMSLGHSDAFAGC